AQDLEDQIAARKLCGVVVRSEREWRAHPQGVAIASRPSIEITRIGDAPPKPLPPGDRPLSGVRVLDMTHVIAGPTCGKSLAEQGATVLHVYCPSRPQLPPFDLDTGHGKLSAFLDIKGVEIGLTEADLTRIRDRDRERLRRLLSAADVFSQSYRPGSLAAKGFSAEDVATLRPGIIVVSFNCYGWGGDSESPWEARPGFEQLAQCATGMAMRQGTPDRPMLCPGFFPNDYISGFLAATGVLAALIRRAEEGGSWHVRVSLCRTAMLLLEQGMVDTGAVNPLPAGFLESYMRECDSATGRLRFLGPVLQFSETPSGWDLPPAPLGAHPPEWPA
ncbi:MAG: CoA transferase, partial [Acetobacteraceae bacterium]